jgi:hypothetical protein
MQGILELRGAIKARLRVGLDNLPGTPTLRYRYRICMGKIPGNASGIHLYYLGAGIYLLLHLLCY